MSRFAVKSISCSYKSTSPQKSVRCWTYFRLPIPITNVSTLKPCVMLNDMINLIICLVIKRSLPALWQVELYSGGWCTCYESKKPLLKTYPGWNTSVNFKTAICIRKMTKTVRYTCCHKLESNQTERAGRMLQFNHRDLDGSWKMKYINQKFCVTETILGHKSNRFFGAPSICKSSRSSLPRILTK